MNMKYGYNALYASLLLMGFASETFAQTDSMPANAAPKDVADVVQTDTEQNFVRLQDVFITVERKKLQGSLLQGKMGVSEKIIDKEVLKQRGANLGDALSDELGIHASGFGGGASSPVIRGQEGKRIKILNSGSDVIDMSAMSPDHAVAVDSMLASQVEVLRGATTLLYGSGNSAGVINVVDNKIPDKLPKKAIEGEAGVRFNTADKEKLITASVTAKLGNHLVARIQGLNRDTDDYKTAKYMYQGQEHKKLANSFADSKSGSFGVSWVGDKGYLGASYSERQDKYGLPAHSHLYDDYYLHVILNETFWRKPYLKHYPFLMEETDIDYNNPGLDCIKKSWHNHSHICGHNHGGSGQHVHNHSEHDNPHIALNTKSFDVRGAWQNPTKFLQTIQFHTGQTRYRHDEKTGSAVDNAFKNKGHQARLEFIQTPIGRLTGGFGFSYLSQKSHALDEHALDYKRQHLLHDHKADSKSFFVVERLTWDKFNVDFGTRLEKQKITMDYNLDLPDDERPPSDVTKPYKSTARSYVMSLNWLPDEGHKFTLTTSHQERLPTAQELYAHGKHLATNAFDVGNKNLVKERSNNIELGWAFTGDKWDTSVSSYYNHFSNYIYSAVLNNKLCANQRCTRSLSGEFPLQLTRYNQSKARIYGIEGQIGYQLTPNYHVAIFGDYVRGKLKDLPSLPTGYKYVYDDERNFAGLAPLGLAKQPDGNAPRMPAGRLGVRVKADLSDNLKGHLQFYRVFDQNKVALLENPTKGHSMLNVGASYEGFLGNQSYTLFVNANNLLNTKAYNHASFLPYIPQSGRSVNVGVNFKF